MPCPGMTRVKENGTDGSRTMAHGLFNYQAFDSGRAV